MFPTKRPRRLRVNHKTRRLVRQIFVKPQNLVYPIFVAENIEEPKEIAAMPNQMHWPPEMAYVPVQKAINNNVYSFLVFGVPNHKDESGTEAYNENNVVCRAIKNIKKHCPEAYIITDVCLCAYTSHGHCGLITESGHVDNDASIKLIAESALAHAKAGADMVAPSDMMDGRIAAIRTTLDDNGYTDTPIMAYSAKYASAFYGPFREAAGSAPGRGDRKGYQMDYAVSAKEACKEFEEDISEGADIIMVKPGIAYLDIVKEASEKFNCPVAVYQVSGEYSMIKAAAEKGWIDERQIVTESLIAMKRAGADIIITYFAPEAGEWLC